VVAEGPPLPPWKNMTWIERWISSSTRKIDPVVDIMTRRRRI
jgi:hypothetical protein